MKAAAGRVPVIAHVGIILTTEEVITHTNAPVIIYNIPQFTGVAFTKDNAHRLLDNPEVVGVKHTSTDLYVLERMRSAYPNKVYFNGFDEMFLSALVAGADPAIGTTINLFALRFTLIRDLYRKGAMAQALVEQEKVNRGVELLVKYGILMESNTLARCQGSNAVLAVLPSGR